MAILHSNLLRLRPYLFHLTAASNADRILQNRRIDSALTLLRSAGEKKLSRQRRREHVEIDVGGARVQLRDQAPLYAGNMALDKGWTFEDFIEHLNSRVFFWPGNESGPISYGLRHYARYQTENPAIIRVATAALLEANPDQAPLFCRYNSGSPRCSNGRKSPRTARTFVTGDDAVFGVGEIVEVTFLDAVSLPEYFEIGATPTGPWHSAAI